MGRQQRKLAAILAADMAGYSRLMAADELGTLARFNALRNELIDPRIELYGGRIVGTAGDSLLIEFASAVDAVQCAVELQDGIATRNADLHADLRMTFRMGIDLGDVIVEGDTIYGHGVNLASRLERLAEPGFIVVGRAVYDQVRGKLPYGFTDLGEHLVKNIPEPVRAFGVEPAAPAFHSPGNVKDPQLPSRPAIAVLPFSSLSEDAEHEYFVDGVTEDLITALSMNRELLVAARHSTFVYKGRSAKVQDIARDLGARYIVEGSVRKSGNRLRVALQLVDAGTGAHQWAERFDLDAADLFVAQDSVVTMIMARLMPAIYDAVASHRQGTPGKELTSYDHLFLAHEAWRTGDMPRYVRHTLLSVEADPRLATAHAELAFCYAIDTIHGASGLTADELEVLSRKHIAMALSLGVRDPETHNVLGNAYGLIGEFERARNQLDLALSLSPNSPLTRFALGVHLSNSGQHAEGRRMILEALTLNPGYMDPAWEVLLQAHYQSRDYAALVRDFVRLNNPRPYMFAVLAAALAQLGRSEAARRAAEDFKTRRPPGLRMDNLAWKFTRSTQQPEDQEHWLQGFRKAGLLPRD